MRPLILGGPDAIDDVDLPFLIAYEHGSPRLPPRLPVFAPSRQTAIFLIRRLSRERDIDTKRWRHYECEHLRGLLDGLLHDLGKDRPVTSFRCELERELWFAMHPIRKKRASRQAA